MCLVMAETSVKLLWQLGARFLNSGENYVAFLGPKMHIAATNGDIWCKFSIDST